MRALEKAVPELHTRLRRERQAAHKWQQLARSMAEALQAEAELRLNVRGDDRVVRSHTQYQLARARHEGLL